MTALRLARLDGVAGLIQLGVQGGRAPAAWPLVRAVADLVGLLRDGAPDPAPLGQVPWPITDWFWKYETEEAFTGPRLAPRTGGSTSTSSKSPAVANSLQW